MLKLIRVVLILVLPIYVEAFDPVSNESLPHISGLPSLLEFQDGRKVTDHNDWDDRRAEMKSVIQYYEYGSIPPKPDMVKVSDLETKVHKSGKGWEHWITLSIHSVYKLKMRMVLYLPNHKKGPYPCIIREEGTLGRTQAIPLFLENGYAFVEYARHDLDPDKKDVLGPAQLAYPDFDWATLAVWAWGGMRVVDYLESRDDIDLSKIGITGHSRGGKMALLAGALDERFSLVVPNGSGAGGAGASRVLGPGAETIGMNDKPHWYHERIQWFWEKESRLPFDQHYLKALVAPRLLLCTESLDDLFANPWGTQITSMAAREIYSFLGVPESKTGLCYRYGKHDSNMEDWTTLLQFAQWHWDDKAPIDSSKFWMTPMDVPSSILQNPSNDSKNPNQSRTIPIQKVQLEVKRIDNPGNQNDLDHYGLGAFGGVSYPYMLGKRKVTILDFVHFLNAVARDDANALYHPKMVSIGLGRAGEAGEFQYFCARSCEDKPIRFINFATAARFCNWMHNGQPSGNQNASTTESGAYDLLKADFNRNPKALFFIPTENEWFKAAYFDSKKGFQLYTAGRNPNLVGHLNEGVSPFGIEDMNDGVWEWNESPIGGLFRGLRSGAWFQGNNRQAAGRFFTNPEARLENIGLRIGAKFENESLRDNDQGI